MNISKLLEKRRLLIDKRLDKILPRENIMPQKLHQAMRYSVFSRGKRLRPILVIESCLCCGGKLRDAINPACAIELLHTFSLIQDDLPAMDDDDYRRGKPSAHKKFDEATAILAADSLLALAFGVIATGRDSRIAAVLLKELANSIGSLGLSGGQCVDIEHNGKKKDAKVLNYINLHKTAALIKASAKIGAQASGAGPKETEAIGRFGLCIGEAFQLVDDVLDGGDSVRVLGEARAVKRARVLTEMAKAHLKGFKDSADVLRALAEYLVERRF